MRDRKHTAWRKNRKFGEVHGGRAWPKLADNIFRRLHSLSPPAPGVVTPVVVQDNPSRDYYFPLDAAQCLAALRRLPAAHIEGLTHLWLRRHGGVDRRAGLPHAEFICGSGVRLIVMYPWRLDRRQCLGRDKPTRRVASEIARFGGEVSYERGWWYSTYPAAGLRDYFTFVLYHEVGHHLDWYQRHWSKANRKQCEDAADDYAVVFSAAGKHVVHDLGTAP